MPAKKSESSGTPRVEMTPYPLDPATRTTLLTVLLDTFEQSPPVGDDYEFQLRQGIHQVVDQVGIRLSKDRLAELVESVFEEVATVGPIQPLMEDPTISEIMVNGPGQIFVERVGKLSQTDLAYADTLHLRFAVNHILNPAGRFVNRRAPTSDSRMRDGSRVNVVIPPVSTVGPCITIRRFMKDKLTIQQLIDLGSLTSQVADFLGICVRAGLNIVVAGNTSSGKTTLLNILSSYIPDQERIIVIEDSAELNLVQTHKITLEAQPPDSRGQGEMTIRGLVKNALRMRPDRIIVGECRGGETIDMLQAMNTGHEGSMTTVHSNSSRDTISRLETTALMAGIDMPVLAIRKQLASALDLIVYLSRMADGSRRMTQITEVVGMEGEVVTLTDLFKFIPAGTDKDGHIQGQLRSTGMRPMFAEKITAAGYQLEPRLFM